MNNVLGLQTYGKISTIFRKKMLQVQIQEKNVSSSLEKKIHLHKIKNIPFANLQCSNKYYHHGFNNFKPKNIQPSICSIKRVNTNYSYNNKTKKQERNKKKL